MEEHISLLFLVISLVIVFIYFITVIRRDYILRRLYPPMVIFAAIALVAMVGAIVTVINLILLHYNVKPLI